MTTRWTASGQPVMGTKLLLPDLEGGTWIATLVGKLYGKRGNSDLVGIVVEATDDKERYRFAWPLAIGDKPWTREEMTLL